MSTYTKVLEFFMQNNVQLNADNMKALQSYCNEGFFDKFKKKKEEKTASYTPDTEKYDFSKASPEEIKERKELLDAAIKACREECLNIKKKHPELKDDFRYMMYYTYCSDEDYEDFTETKCNGKFMDNEVQIGGISPNEELEYDHEIYDEVINKTEDEFLREVNKKLPKGKIVTDWSKYEGLIIYKL